MCRGFDADAGEMLRALTTLSALIFASSCLGGCGSDAKPKAKAKQAGYRAPVDQRVSNCRGWEQVDTDASTLTLRPGEKVVSTGGMQDGVCDVVGRPGMYRIVFVPFVTRCSNQALASTISVPEQGDNGRVEHPVFRIAPSKPQPVSGKGTCLLVGRVFEATAAHYVSTDDPNDIRVIYDTPR